MEQVIDEAELKRLMEIQKSFAKTEKPIQQSANIVEVFDKYKSLTGYKVVVKTIKKGVLTNIFKIGGRISRNDAYQLAIDEKERLIRKYKV